MHALSRGQLTSLLLGRSWLPFYRMPATLCTKMRRSRRRGSLWQRKPGISPAELKSFSEVTLMPMGGEVLRREALDLSTSSIEHKWRRIQSCLRAELGDDVFTSWFGRVELEGYDGRVVQVSVPTKFLRNWLQSHYSESFCPAAAPNWAA